MYRRFFKRFIDFFAAILVLVFASPLLFIVSVALHFANRGSGVFFLQDRSGKNAQTFRIVKFKTMTEEKDNNGELLPDSKRITKVGRFIRSASIDELPQLINVLKGDMSLIGPRPLLIQYLPLYSPEQARRHEVRPGITGWAQVNGRNTIKWEQKFKLDVWYVDNFSFKTDLLIMFKTIKKVLFRSDINFNQNTTMPSLNGKN